MSRINPKRDDLPGVGLSTHKVYYYGQEDYVSPVSAQARQGLLTT